MKSDKRNILLGVLIAAIVLTLLFLVVRIDGVFIVAYCFALIGLIGVAMSASSMLKQTDAYPWITALPRQALRYLIAALSTGAVVVVLDQFQVWSIPLAWMILLQAAILGFFAVQMIMLRGGVDHIRQTGSAVRGQSIPAQVLHSDVLTLAGRATDPEVKASLNALADRMRYADPMGAAPEITVLDANIRQQIQILAGTLDSQQACADRCRQITLLLEERNRLCRIGKGADRAEPQG